jgi:hypothetical protein
MNCKNGPDVTETTRVLADSHRESDARGDIKPVFLLKHTAANSVRCRHGNSVSRLGEQMANLLKCTGAPLHRLDPWQRRRTPQQNRRCDQPVRCRRRSHSRLESVVVVVFKFTDRNRVWPGSLAGESGHGAEMAQDKSSFLNRPATRSGRFVFAVSDAGLFSPSKNSIVCGFVSDGFLVSDESICYLF